MPVDLVSKLKLLFTGVEMVVYCGSDYRKC